MALIDRQAAIDALMEILDRPNHAEFLYTDEICKALEELPSAQPQRIKGRWERKESDLSWWYECSSCGETPLYSPYSDEVLTPFCPWCGARM